MQDLSYRRLDVINGALCKRERPNDTLDPKPFREIEYGLWIHQVLPVSHQSYSLRWRSDSFRFCAQLRA
jgi:hypothetical protein